MAVALPVVAVPVADANAVNAEVSTPSMSWLSLNTPTDNDATTLIRPTSTTVTTDRIPRIMEHRGQCEAKTLVILSLMSSH